MEKGRQDLKVFEVFKKSILDCWWFCETTDFFRNSSFLFSSGVSFGDYSCQDIFFLM